MLRVRRAVQEMHEYHPPLARRTGLRLDFNENTEGCSPKVLERIRRITADELARYPEREPLEMSVAERLGVGGTQVLLTNGTDEAIHLLCEVYLEPENEVIIVTPTFGMYEIYAEMTGAHIVRAQAKGEFRFPLAQVLNAITPPTKLIAIASPNNPTGTSAARDDVLAICAAAPDAAVLIDEAYFQFHGTTVIPDIASTPNLFVARTFSKAYGLAGLRMGILAGPEPQMPLVRRVSSPYSVNAVALLALPAALDDQEYMAGYVRQVLQGKQRLAEELEALRIRYWRSDANFLLVSIGQLHREFVLAMRQRGILVRDRSSDPGCDGCVRITIGTQSQMDQLLPALREVFAEFGLAAGVRG